jgi:hypothetical protein
MIQELQRLVVARGFAFGITLPNQPPGQPDHTTVQFLHLSGLRGAHDHYAPNTGVASIHNDQLRDATMQDAHEFGVCIDGYIGRVAPLKETNHE